MSKSIYFFGNKNADGNGQMKDALGGKGANLAEMSKLGISVPPGFTISTTECGKYYENNQRISNELEKDVEKYVKKLEDCVGYKFNSDTKPLLVSVRSGAKFSMPGMMDTILNLGLNDKTVLSLAEATKNRRFAFDSYRRFIQMYSDVVLGIDHHKFEQILEHIKLTKNIIKDSDLSAEDLEIITVRYKQIVLQETGSEFVQDIRLQLLGAIEAVFKSWMNERAIIYRKLNDINANIGTAVTVQAMVFGNMGETSGTGVAFTRNPSNGLRKVYGEYLINAQGEDVVAGIRTPSPLLKEDGANSMEEVMPKTYKELIEIFAKLEDHYKDMQDVEFTIQEGKLWILQTRNGKRAIKASVKIAVDMVNEGKISKDLALTRIDASQLDQLLHPVIDRKTKLDIVAKGLPASPGAISGKIAFSTEEATQIKASGENAMLVRVETSPDDIGGMHISSGILTARGGMTSHAAVVARGMGKPCVSGCETIAINEKEKTLTIKQTGLVLKSGDWITIDGSTGEVINGKAKTTNAASFEEFDQIMKWADETRVMNVRANAETSLDCKTAIEFGAQGIGLCRTEHMFFEKEKLMHFRKMILSSTKEDRINALFKIEELQISDFIEIFKITKNLSTNIRLLDPPLHEFIPQTEAEIDELSEFFGIEKNYIKEKSTSLHELNPMLGHRGSRLGITYPEIFEMQIRAIIKSACIVEKQLTILPKIEIMLPVIIEKKELKILADLVRKTADEIIKSENSKIKYKVGTMIEIPRACIMANEIAEIADYFSFGTNDLTQTTLGISRDDAQKFLGEYVKKDILENDPFVSIDTEGVGAMMKIAIEKARKVKPEITLSVCGEHGGDAKSIEFFSKLGLNYISCSPYRIPIARLAAAKEEAILRMS